MSKNVHGRGFIINLKASDRGLKRLNFSDIFPINCNVNPDKSKRFTRKIEDNTEMVNSATGLIPERQNLFPN